MSGMSASDYVRQYRTLVVSAVGPTGKFMTETVCVTRYQVNGSSERSKLMVALKKVLGLKHLPNLASTTEMFTFPKGDVMGTGEPFFWQSLKRAYYFKGSPSEIRDALRLAYRCGRIGTGKDVAGQPVAALTMAQYASQFFGLDCNGLVGNYFNLSPALWIGSYASISAREEDRIAKKVEDSGYWNGWARAEMLSLAHIPLAPRQSASEAKTGDVLVDVEDGTKYAHIGTVEEVTAVDKETVSWRVVEWGQASNAKNFETDKDEHIKPLKKVKLTKGPKKSFGVGHLSMNGKRFRYLFAGPENTGGPATFGRCGEESA